jgi:hypothetical protein
MAIESISKGINIISSTINTLKILKDMLPTSTEKRDVEESLKEAEKNIKIAEAEIAQGLDYILCRRHFPPGIMLDIDEYKIQCNTCGFIEDID